MSGNPVIGHNRMRFHAYPGNDPQASIDSQLQDFLQMILDRSNIITSVQQTREYRDMTVAPDGELRWQEFLIISEQ